MWGIKVRRALFLHDGYSEAAWEGPAAGPVCWNSETRRPGVQARRALKAEIINPCPCAGDPWRGTLGRYYTTR